MKHYSCEPAPMVCCQQIDFDIDENNCIHNLKFHGGCPGNLTAVGRLVEGMNVDEAIKKFSGIQCGAKPTSCTDQFSRILEKIKNQ